MNQIPYERVKLARDNSRPTGLDYINNIFKGFFELHGDRRYGDDTAIVGGLARLNDISVTVIAIEKGHTARERAMRNFGAPNPEGYRKALRLMKQAEKFGRPIVCLIDTSGAYCGIGAEERGQGQAIAENLMEMSTLCVHRRRRQRRRIGAGCRRPRMDAAKRCILSDIPRGLRQHSVEGRRQGGGRSRKPEADRRGCTFSRHN